MLPKCQWHTLLLVICSLVLCKCRSYNNGLIFYDLKTQTPYLPPTVSVSRGRNLASVKYSEKGSIWSHFGQPCDCRGAICGCCAGIKVKQYDFDQKMCANVTYMARQQEALLEVYLNERPSSKYGISSRNPSPFCIPIMMGVPMAMCVQMSNIGVQGNNLNMCMDFVVRLATTDLFEMHFQCMKMGLDGIMYVDKNGQPVIPPSMSKTGTKPNKENEPEYEYDEASEDETGSTVLTENDKEINEPNGATVYDTENGVGNELENENEYENESENEKANEYENESDSESENEITNESATHIKYDVDKENENANAPQHANHELKGTEQAIDDGYLPFVYLPESVENENQKTETEVIEQLKDMLEGDQIEQTSNQFNQQEVAGQQAVQTTKVPNSMQSVEFIRYPVSVEANEAENEISKETAMPMATTAEPAVTSTTAAASAAAAAAYYPVIYDIAAITKATTSTTTTTTTELPMPPVDYMQTVNDSYSSSDYNYDNAADKSEPVAVDAADTATATAAASYASYDANDSAADAVDMDDTAVDVDISNGSDAAEVSDASDAFDASDTSDASDVADAADASNVSAATDVSDTDNSSAAAVSVDLTDTTNLTGAANVERVASSMAQNDDTTATAAKGTANTAPPATIDATSQRLAMLPTMPSISKMNAAAVAAESANANKVPAAKPMAHATNPASPGPAAVVLSSASSKKSAPPNKAPIAASNTMPLPVTATLATPVTATTATPQANLLQLIYRRRSYG